MCWNSGVGTRTKSIRPVMWLKRVGLSQVSNDWRLTFFSSAPSIRTQGLSTAAGVATKDMQVPCLIARRAFVDPGRNRNAEVRLTLWREARKHFSLAGKCIGIGRAPMLRSID